MTLKRGESDADNRTMRNRIVLAAAASGLALAAVVGVAMGVGHDEPRLVRTAGVSAPLEEFSTTSTSLAPAADEAEKMAELDATVEKHETRISNLESTTTTAPAAQTTATTAPIAEAVASPSTTTTTATVPPTTQPAPTTTTTFYGPPWWCPVQAGRGQAMVPCDSTTTTTSPVG